MISLPFGPGSAVLISGRFGGAIVLVDMMLSPSKNRAVTDNAACCKQPWLDKQKSRSLQKGDMKLRK